MISEVTWLLLEDMLTHAREAVGFWRIWMRRVSMPIGCAGPLLFARRRLLAKQRRRSVANSANSCRQSLGEKLRVFRNILIHGYRDIRTTSLVDTVRKDFPPLIAEIERILNAGAQGQP